MSHIRCQNSSFTRFSPSPACGPNAGDTRARSATRSTGARRSSTTRPSTRAKAREWTPGDRTADFTSSSEMPGRHMEDDGHEALGEYKRAVAAIYTARAPRYDTGSSYDNHIRWSSGLVADIDPLPGERILDIATGTGMAALALAKAVGPDGSVVALDISHGALAQLERKAAEAGAANVQTLLQDAESACFEPGQFDAIVCSSALTWMEDIPGALVAWRDWLKPGGRLGFHAYSERSFLTGYALSEVALEMGLPDMNPHRLYGTPQRCQSMVEACGYVNTKIRVVDESQWQELEDMLGAWDGLLNFTWPRMGAAGNPVARLPAEDLALAHSRYDEWLTSRAKVISGRNKVWDEHQIYYVLAKSPPTA